MSSRAPFVRDPDNRRQSLIEACAAGLAEDGATGVSVRSICARAGVSPGLLRHYFAGIDELIAATYVHVAAQVSEALATAVEAAGGDPRARLSAYVTGSFAPPISAPELLATWLAFWSLVKTRPDIAALHRQIYTASLSELEELLRAAGAPAAEARTAAIAVTALVDGLWLELSLDAGAFTSADACAMAERWLSGWLGREDPLLR
ncbi:transcriptional regulator BetI [Sandaracinobacteroides hominis]|uniref:transcriptional regulator BetI n=1 Tax=Sandaracinobacteroides hominis TaxID=2780086 RepID=UPI0018F44BF1|nr:transcriptional regulator BetI [Sandaracinobacteroides hominis]